MLKKRTFSLLTKPYRIFDLVIVLWLISGCAEDIKINVPESELRAEVSGRVYPRSSGAMVYIINMNVIDYVKINESSGSFKLEGLPLDSYKIRIVADHYGITEDSIDVDMEQMELGIFYLKTNPSQIDYIRPEDSTVINSSFWKTNSSNVTDSTLWFKIYFTESMDGASVKNALTINPDTDKLEPEIYYYSSNYSPYLRIKFKKEELLQVEELVLTLTTEAQTQDGIPLDYEYVLRYFIDTSDTYIAATSLISTVEPYNRSTGVGVEEHIELVFKEEMDRKSVENAFFITPSQPGNFFWEALSSGKVQLEVRYAKPLTFSTSYTYGLKGGFCNKENECTKDQIEFSFVTTELELEQYRPYNGVDDFPLDSIFYYQFNYRIENNFLNAFSITPSVDSLEMVETYDKAIKIKHALLQPETEYSIIIDSSVLGVSHNNPGVFLKQTFVTGTEILNPTATSVTGIRLSPKDTTTLLDPDAYFTIIFADSMLQESVDSRFSITPYVPCDLDWSSGYYNSSVRVKPRQPLKSGTLYTIVIDSGFEDIHGEVFQKFTGQIKTKPFTLTSFRPYYGQVNVAVDVRISLEFTTGVDSISLRQNFQIEPAVDSLEFSYSSSDGSVTVRHKDFKVDTKYTATLSKKITDKFGSPLAKEYV
ncbi:MAG: Ig-like domain-containing protein, partial [Fibrobacteria bacterium]|nr:Ig-like domain-containing protein [Fibrobacteria bacterium]